MQIIDKSKVAARFAQAKTSYDHHAIAQQQIIQHLLTLLDKQITPPHFDKVLEIGCGTGMLTAHFWQKYQANTFIANDLTHDYESLLQAKLAAYPIEYHFGDAEQIEFDQPFDLILSSSAIQWFENKEKFIEKASKMLNHGGMLLFNTFTKENLFQVRQITKTGLNYPSKNQWRAYLAPYFDILALEEDNITLHFRSVDDVFMHLANTGVSHLSHLPAHRLQKIALTYRQKFHQIEGFPLSYTPLYILARKK